MKTLLALLACVALLSGCASPSSRAVGKTAGRVAMVPVGVAIGTVTWPLAFPFGVYGVVTSEDKGDRDTSLILIGWPVGCPYLLWQISRSLDP